MARFATPKNSFLAGEVSPKAYGRSDLPEYAHAAKKLQNMLALLQGDAAMRPGTQYVRNSNSVPTNPANGRLIEFVFSKTEAYAIFISPTAEQSILVFRNDGTPCVCAFNSTPRTDYTYFPPNYLHSELYEIQYAQSGDTLILTHPNHRPHFIQRLDSNVFQVIPFDDFGKFSPTTPANAARALMQFPYMDANTTDLTLTPGAVGGIGTTLNASRSFFNPGHVGTYFKVTQAANTGVMFITGYVSPTQVTGTVIVNFANTTASSDWREGSWSDYRGWPRTVAFFEGRVIYGGTAFQPDTLWGSKVGNYFHLAADMLVQDWGSNFTGIGFFGSSTASQVVLATHPFSFTLASTEINQIQWFSTTSGTLSIGTLGAEYTANGGTDRILSALSPSFVPQTNYGSAFVRAQKAGPATLFVSRDGKKIRDFSYDVMKGSFKSQEISLFVDHLFRSDLSVQGSADPEFQILGMAYQSSRNMVWVLLQGYSQSQSLVAFTFDKDKQIVAFHRHLLGGSNQQVNSVSGAIYTTAPQVTGMAVIPNVQGTHDELWLNVVRWINGAPSYTIEKIGMDFDGKSFNLDYSNANHVPLFSDCAAVKVLSSPSTSVTGLTWLKGQTVNVLADGRAHPAVTVDSTGAITLSFAASQIVVGLPFVGRIELLPPEAGAVLGSALGSIMRVEQASIRFFGTMGAKMGQGSNSNLETINFVPAGQPMSQAVAPFTGVKRLPFSGEYSEDFSFVLVQDLPLPMNVSSITLRGNTNET